LIKGYETTLFSLSAGPNRIRQRVAFNFTLAINYTEETTPQNIQLPISK